MRTIEEEEIRIEREVLKRRKEALNERESRVFRHKADAASITADSILLREDIDSNELNYVLGHSAGYVNGFQAAIDTITTSLSSEYRDIPITEDELYVLVALGEQRERAWLKDFNQKSIADKSGWRYDFTRRCPIWVKDEEKEE